MTHSVIWTHFILANLPFQDFPNHIYCLQHLKRIWREVVHGSSGRTHSCTLLQSPIFALENQGVLAAAGTPQSCHAKQEGISVSTWLLLHRKAFFFFQAEWRFFGLGIPSFSSSPLSWPSRKQKNTKWTLFLLMVPPAFQIEKVGDWLYSFQLPPKSTFSYRVPLAASMCSFRLSFLLSSVFCHPPSSSLTSFLG